MNTSQELLEQWKDYEECLIRFSRKTLEGVNIPKVDKEFLAVYGVPDLFFIPLLKAEDATLPRLPNSLPGTENLPTEYGRYRVIGDKGCRMFMCLDEGLAGRVVYVNGFKPEKIKVVFSNSSYHQLVAFWTAQLKHGKLIENACEEDKDRQIALYEETLRRIDPAALKKGADWARWLVILKRDKFFL